MNTELIPFNWEEYSKGGWEAVYNKGIVTEISKPDNGLWHFFNLNGSWVQSRSINMQMRRKLRDAWVIIYQDEHSDVNNEFHFSESDLNESKKIIEGEGYTYEIHHIKTLL